jgi:hypothetical protein
MLPVLNRGIKLRKHYTAGIFRAFSCSYAMFLSHS